MVQFLAVCNVAGFAVLAVFIGTGNALLRWLVNAIDAPLSLRMARFLDLPAWMWVACFLSGSAIVAIVHLTVRRPAAAVLVQTAIGIGQIAAVMACGTVWIVSMLRLPR
jgi:uncharacterized membrane protein YhdT